MYIVQLALASDNTYSVTSTRPERTVTKIYITQSVEGKRSNRSDSFLFFSFFFFYSLFYDGLSVALVDRVSHVDELQRNGLCFYLARHTHP